VRASNLASHKEIVEWLKSEHSFGHGHATAIAQHYLNPEKWAD